MIQASITIGNKTKQIHIPQSNSEILLDTYIKMIAVPLPDQDEELSEMQAAANRYKYYATILSIVLGNLSVNECLQIPTNYLIGLYNKVIEAATLPMYDDKHEFKPFSFDGQMWYYPKQYMKNCTTQGFLEAAELQRLEKDLNQGNYTSLAGVAACILRKTPNEEFNEQQHAERSEIFKTLPISKAFEVGFFLSKRKSLLKKHLYIYSKMVQILQTSATK